MNREQFQREKDYGAGVCIAKKLLSRGLITSAEYSRVKAALLHKHRPVISSLTDAPPGDFPKAG